MFAKHLQKLANAGGPEVTYEAGCHCGYISLSVKLSPPLPEHEVVNCNCSICRRGGYLLVCMNGLMHYVRTMLTRVTRPSV
jgi:hypothetical protein